jgi:HK97 family phage prohead protease
MTNHEKRGGLLGLETRTDTDKRTLVGYAAVYNSDTVIADYFVERIAPGAFDKTIAGDVRALFNHDPGRVIGRTKSGTLRLSVDSRGLKFEVDVPNTSDGNDLLELVGRGDITGCSFGFEVTRQEWDETGKMPVRTILEVSLAEISPCTFPAYDDTTIALRSLESARKEARQSNFVAASRRVSERKARAEARFRRIE